MSAVSPLAQILRAYAFAYTAAHDFGASDRIMADAYVLRMGPLAIRGRREEYQPATLRQYEQFPGLGFTVHRLVSNGERAAFHFTEHGLSVHAGREAAWQGVSLYRWNQKVLTECRVEQDYYARRRQLADGRPDEITAPARDPWTDSDRPADERVEERLRTWLTTSAWHEEPAIQHDDGTERPLIEDARTEVLDLFSAGSAGAFHAVVRGTYAGGLSGDDDLRGRAAALYVSGIVDLATDGSVAGVVVTDRSSMLRRMRDAQAGS